MTYDSRISACHGRRKQAPHVVRQNPRHCVAKTLASRRGGVIGAAPLQNLLVAPAPGGIVLAKGGEVPIVAFIQRRIGDDRSPVGAGFLSENLGGSPGSVEGRAKETVGNDVERRELPADIAHLVYALCGQCGFAGSGEPVGGVGLALAMSDQNEMA